MTRKKKNNRYTLPPGAHKVEKATPQKIKTLQDLENISSSARVQIMEESILLKQIGDAEGGIPTSDDGPKKRRRKTPKYQGTTLSLVEWTVEGLRDALSKLRNYGSREYTESQKELSVRGVLKHALNDIAGKIIFTFMSHN